MGEKYVRWEDIRDRAIALVGGEEAVAARTAELLAQCRAYRLAEARKRTGHTQREVAKAMGITPGRVSQIEHGGLGTSEVETLSRYAQALGGRLRIVVEFDDDLMQIA